jgi:hypothetical protein
MPPFQPSHAWSLSVLRPSRPANTRSARVNRGLEELTYPFHDQTVMVTRCGRICFHGRKVNLSHVFAGQSVGVTQVAERIWLVTFMQYDLGYFDDETCRLEPIEKSVRTETVTYPLGIDQGQLARPAGLEPATSWFVA